MKKTNEITDAPTRLEDINEQFEDWMEYIEVSNINARLLPDDLFEGTDELDKLMRELKEKEVKFGDHQVKTY